MVPQNTNEPMGVVVISTPTTAPAQIPNATAMHTNTVDSVTNPALEHRKPPDPQPVYNAEGDEEDDSMQLVVLTNQYDTEEMVDETPAMLQG